IIDHDKPNADSIGIDVLAEGVTIANLAIQNGTNWGIRGSRDGTKISGVRVVGVHGNLGGAISIAGNGTQIVASEVRACGPAGILLLGNQVTVKGNVVAQVAAYGVYLEGDEGQIMANKVTTVGYATPYLGIGAHGERNVVSANVLENVGNSLDSAIGLDVVDTDPLVQGNKLVWAGLASLRCIGCNGGKLSLNSVFGSSGAGFLAVYAAPLSPDTTLLVQGNKVAETALHAFALDAFSINPGTGLVATRNSAADSGFGVRRWDCFFVSGRGETL